jgi:hypothetical protein
VKRAGAVAPFFLRNDDVEYCLRLRAVGAKICVNPNIFAWHESVHNAVGEFYALLHGLVVNATYFDLQREQTLRKLLRNSANAASVGNTVLLECLNRAIHLYVSGPEWLENEFRFGEYREAVSAMRTRLLRYEQVPREVVESLRTRDSVEIHSLVAFDTSRKNRLRDVVFFDETNSRYLCARSDEKGTMDALLASFVVNLSVLASEFDGLKSKWRQFIHAFDGQRYWNKYFEVTRDSVTQRKIRIKASVRHKQQDFPRPPPEVGETTPIASQNGLPDGFSPARYFELNPDVQLAGADAVEHYLQFGRNEGRRFR